MKLVLNIVGGLMILVGIVWFLQGINILPGSFMTGQSQWAVAGAGMLIAGGVLLYFNNRRSDPGAPPG
jgi:hypothetical protein